MNQDLIGYTLLSLSQCTHTQYIGVLIFLMLVTFLAAIYGFLQRPGAVCTS